MATAAADATTTVLATATLVTTATAASAVVNAVVSAAVSVVVEATAAAATTGLLAALRLRGAATTLRPLAVHPHLPASMTTAAATTRSRSFRVCGFAATGY